MVIKILELGILTVLTEEEEESYKGGIAETVTDVTGAVKAIVNNTGGTTIPLTISGAKDAVKLTTDPLIDVVQKQPETT
ncbi:hypothetical protein [Nostoc favosum]|uniref:Uncharacterized protein n=1 Tax=Nostoc favosum CHAB5714 TaxID=2780399 RepID=A0ABS8I4S3_9NOSO|nr:hypothetical protein [Nostoc favosum]MCC5599202.1 hypothetical protein [Nostoc favosum CHAB5714]